MIVPNQPHTDEPAPTFVQKPCRRPNPSAKLRPDCRARYGAQSSHIAHSILLWKGRDRVATYLAFHEVDDVEHWLSSPKREEIFGPMGITARTFRDPEGSKRVGLIVEIPDMAAFQEFMQTEAAADAMQHDGVHPETMLILSEG